VWCKVFFFAGVRIGKKWFASPLPGFLKTENTGIRYSPTTGNHQDTKNTASFNQGRTV